MRHSFLFVIALTAGCSANIGDPAQREPAGSENVASESEAIVALPVLQQRSPRWTFQGAFQVDDCVRNDLPNPWFSGGSPLTCPGLPTTGPGERALMPESGCGGNQYQCNTTTFNQASNMKIGGLFQIDDCGVDNITNLLMGGFSCPSGFFQAAIGRIVAPDTGCGATQYLCYARPDQRTNNAPYNDVRYGGRYQIDDCGTSTAVNNLTGATSCPAPYVKVPYGRVKAPEGSQCGITQYMCLATEI
jgi:hypothetical protein